MINLKKIGFVFVCLLSMELFSTAMAQHTTLYVGTYTSKEGSEGVLVYDFDELTGKSTLVNTISMSNPSFLVKSKQMLYAVNEDSEGMLAAIDLRTNKVLDILSTNGAHPCHVAISPKQPILVVSNYTGGSMVLYSLAKDGRLNRQEDFIQFHGSSINKERQSKSHIHSAFFSNDGSKLFVSDLGADLIYVFAIEEKSDGFAFREVDRIEVKKGGGPRHLIVSKDATCIYSVLELTGELAVYKLIGGMWKNTQVLPIYNHQFGGEQGAADIKISDNGKFVYATNRGGANVITCYRVLKDNNLQVYDIVSSGGISPRNLNFSKSENWLFVTNQVSNKISVFKRNKNTGKVEEKESAAIRVSKPVCVVY